MRKILIVLAILAQPVLVQPILAQPVLAEEAVPQSLAQMQLSFAPVVAEAAPSVVNIYARRIVTSRASPFASDPFFSQFFGQIDAAPRIQNSLGSGVIVSPDGLVVSNFHVVGGAEDIRVVLSDRREFSGSVILSDRDSDLAIIQLEGAQDLPVLTMADSDAAEVGDLVLAIGNPFGVGQTVTSGIVSGLARSGGIGGQGQGYFIQTDAAINPGNSGGALIDMEGQLLGINTSILTQSGGSNGIGFAIPANLVRQYVEQAGDGAATLQRPWAGIAVQTVDAALAEALGLSIPRGVVITDLHPDSPFLAAGLTAGDVILTFDGLPVDAEAELRFRLATQGIGGTATVTYWRDGAERSVDIAMMAAPEQVRQSLEPRRLSTDTVFDGLLAAELTPSIRTQLGLAPDTAGVLVLSADGASRRLRLQEGDVLVSINGAPTGSLAALETLAATKTRRVTLEVIRDGRRLMMQLLSF